MTFTHRLFSLSTALGFAACNAAPMPSPGPLDSTTDVAADSGDTTTDAGVDLTPPPPDLGLDSEPSDSMNDPITDAVDISIDGPSDVEDTLDALTDADVPCVPSTEICNALDDDCDGTADEGLGVGASCRAGVGECTSQGLLECSEGEVVCRIHPSAPTPEICDGFDNDCDGEYDEDCAECGTLDWTASLPTELANLRIAGSSAGTALAIGDSSAFVIDAAGQALPLDLPAEIAALDLVSRAGGGALALGRTAFGTTLSAIRPSGELLWTSELEIDGALSGAVTESGSVAWVAIASADAETVTTSIIRVDLTSETRDAIVWPLASALLTGSLAGLAADETSVFVATNEPAALHAFGVDGVHAWTVGLADEAVFLREVALQETRLAISGENGPDGGSPWVATYDRDTGANASMLQLSSDPAGRTNGLSIDRDGDIVMGVDLGLDETRVSTTIRLTPGRSSTNWEASYRYTSAIDSGPDPGDGWISAHRYDGPTGESTVIRRFQALCDAERSTSDVLLFFLAGQSNMDGYGLLTEIDPSFAEPFPEINLFWARTGVLQSLRPAGALDGRIGPEVSFGRDVASAYPNQRIMLIKYSVGGTNLYLQWHPGDTTDADERGPLYRTWQTVVETALRLVHERELEPKIQGMVWMQGESDGFGSGEAMAYQTNLARFIRRTRDDLGVEATVPFSVGRIFAPTVPERLAIQRAQTATSDAMYGVSWVNTDDLGLTDSIHYDGPGQVSLGRRLAAAVINERSVLGRETEPTPSWEDHIEEFDEFELALRLDVPLDAAWIAEGDLSYEIDRREELAEFEITRVAYLLQLGARDRADQWVWVSFPPFAPSVMSVGVPVDEIWEGPLTDVSVRSNVIGDTDDADGRIEFWSDCYAPGEDEVFDAFDEPYATDCYGSMQVHATSTDGALSTVFALNHWLYGNHPDIGIGDWGGRNPDWTFSRASSTWETRRLSVFVR